MQINSTHTYLISVHPRWASAFFLSHNPKTIELRKGSFGAGLKPGDRIAIYATLPTAEVLGIVRVLKRESLPIDRLWRESRQGQLAKVSREQFKTYYTNQESGIGVWVALPNSSPVRSPFQTSAKLGPSLATAPADSTANRRSNNGTEHRPLNIANTIKLYLVTDEPSRTVL
jgi:predicted transcriptional regulator